MDELLSHPLSDALIEHVALARWLESQMNELVGQFPVQSMIAGRSSVAEYSTSQLARLALLGYKVDS